MGRTMDALLHRSSLKASKFKPLVNLAVHRLAVLKNQRQARCNIAKSDVVEILKMGFHDRALLRVEHVIKEQNMLDVLHMVESYCNLVLERFHLIEQEKECPEELKEAIASLLYAASRIGECPELQEIRGVLTSHYGKEFAARAIELRNNCGVSATLIHKLSTRMPSLESRMCVLKQIADENGIALQLGEPSVEASYGPAVSQAASPKVEGDSRDREIYYGPGKTRKYDNAADAAQAAFESAAYAAEAARAAVELSRGHSHDTEGSNSPFKNMGYGIQTDEIKASNREENSSSFSDEDVDIDIEEPPPAALEKSVSSSSSSSNSSENLDLYATDASPNKENQTDEMELGIAPSDLLTVNTLEKTDDPPGAADSDKMAMAEDPVNQAPEGSWIRREWNSKIEKMKRPFSHRSRGVSAR